MVLRFFLIVAFFLPAFSMNSNAQMGNVTKEELEMTYYDKDSSAGAVILYDYGQLYFTESNFDYKFYKRIKIFNQEYADLGTVSMRVPSYYYVGKIKAICYNLENGQIVTNELDKKLIYTTKDGDYKIIKFTIPTIKPGSVIEYSYIWSSMSNIQLPTWYFQAYVPVKYSELNFKHVPFVFGYELQTFFPLAVNEHDNVGKTWRWTMKDLPAFQDESFIINEDDYLSKLVFFVNPPLSIEAGWRDVVNGIEVKNRFLVQDILSFLQPEVERIKKESKDSLDMMKQCYYYISQNFKVTNTKGQLQSGSLKKVFETKSGSRVEINLMLYYMLKQAGFTCFPFILSTRSNGRIDRSSYPSKNNFNYLTCLVAFEKQNYLLDATDKYRPYNLYYSDILDCQGVVINKGDVVFWIKVHTKESYSENCSLTLKLDENGSIKGTGRLIFKGYGALESRKLIASNGQESYIKELRHSFPLAELKDIKIENSKDIEKDLVIHFSVAYEDTIPPNNNTIFINPNFLLTLKENPFKQPVRNYPLDFKYPEESKYTVTLTLPANYKIDTAPEEITLLSGDSSSGYSYQGRIVANNIFQLQTKYYRKSYFYPSSAYPQLKELANEIIKKEKEDLIVIKE